MRVPVAVLVARVGGVACLYRGCQKGRREREGGTKCNPTYRHKHARRITKYQMITCGNDRLRCSALQLRIPPVHSHTHFHNSTAKDKDKHRQCRFLRRTIAHTHNQSSSLLTHATRLKTSRQQSQKPSTRLILTLTLKQQPTHYHKTPRTNIPIHNKIHPANRQAPAVMGLIHSNKRIPLHG